MDGDERPMGRRVTAITIHKISGKETRDVEVLEQQPNGSWAGTCSRCAKPFLHDTDPTFERQVLVLCD
jgi:hypothetical protein